MSPAAAFRLPLAILFGVHHGWREIDPAARAVHATHVHIDRIPEPHRLPRALTYQRRALLVEVPPLAAHRPRRKEALEALVAEAHERAAAHQAHHLALERAVPAVLVQALV